MGSCWPKRSRTISRTSTEFRLAWPCRFGTVRSRAPSGTIKSAYDGQLGRDAPTDARAWDSYTVDYNASSGQASRWVFPSSPGQPRKVEVTALDRAGLTYTTPALTEDTEITGYPIVH